MEDAKLMNYKRENSLRKHNYVPFIINLLKNMHEKGVLSEKIEQAKNVKANA